MDTPNLEPKNVFHNNKVHHYKNFTIVVYIITKFLGEKRTGIQIYLVLFKNQ